MYVGLAIVSAGGGNSNAVADDRIAVGTGQDIEGDANFTWDGAVQTINGRLAINHQGASSGTPSASLAITPASSANWTSLANAEVNDVLFNLARTVQFDGGEASLAEQFAFEILAPTYDAETAAFTIALAATLRIDNAPVGGSGNVTITAAYALYIDDGNVYFYGDLTVNAVTAGGLVTANAGLTVGAGVHTVPVGAVGTPSFTFAGDPNTGVYHPAADQVALSAGGAQVLRAVNTSGVLTAVLTGALTVNGAAGSALITLTDAANISTDADDGNVFKVTLGGNRTLDNPTNLVAGFTYVFIVVQDGTGSRTLAYGNAFLWPSDAAPVLSTAAGAIDVISAVCLSTTQLLCTYRFAFA